jgi:uncharacterized protein involved in exopolysaccharide biosynthesis
MFMGDNSSQNKNSLPVLTEISEDGTTNVAASLNEEEKQRADTYAGYLLGGLNVDQTLGTNLVNIRLQGTNPELLATVANSVGTVFIEKDREREMQGANTTYADLTSTIEKLKQDIATQEQDRLVQMQNSGIPLQTEGEKVSAARLQEMSSQWLAAEGKRRDIQAEYEAAVEASRNGNVFAIIRDDRAIQDAQSQALKNKAYL